MKKINNEQKNTYPIPVKSNIKLTVGMLVSNHVEYIRKVMDALQPLLKAVPSELVIIDTKGEESDGSIAICREYTDKIYRFEWCNDFSAARNFCLSHAKGEWFMYQDDDEWFDDVQEFIDFFKSGQHEHYFSGYYYTRDYHGDGTYSMGIAGRMIRRTDRTKFVGKVHETFNEVYAPNKMFNCFTHHMGYVYTTPEAKKKHQDRNLSILREEFQKYGYQIRICAQMVQELLSIKDTAKEGFDFAMECAEEFEKRGELMNSAVQWILVATVRYFTILDDYQGVIQQAEKILARYPLTQMAQLALAAVVTLEASKKDDIDMVSLFSEIYVKQWDWLKAHENEALLQTQMDFPRYYTELFYYNLVGLGAIAANWSGDYILANSYWKRLPWQQEDFDGAKYAKEMQKTIEGLKNLVAGKKKENAPKEIKLTIGLLVSNRKKYIRNVLEGLKPLLDAVPSELIIVDTKGEESDGSIEICREYTDKIYSFNWCDDFSAARNVCLEHARGEWFMYQDDDEWFDDVQEFIDFFNSGESDKYSSGYYHTRNYKSDGSFSDGMAGRLIRLNDNTRFVGRVHEGFNEVQGPSKIFRSFVHHYGYVFKDEEESERHQSRNLLLLKKELEISGRTPRICAQIMQEYLSRKETADEGMAFFEDSLKELKNQNVLMDACTQWMLVASVRYYKIKKDYQGLLAQAEYIAENFGLTQVAQMALAGVVIETSAPQGNVGAILTYAPLYKAAWQWMKVNESAALSQKQLDFPKYIAKDYAIQIFQAAANSANAVKDYVTAYSYWEMLPWNDKSFDGSQYLAGMQETLAGLEQTV